MIELLWNDYYFINIDETNISKTDFRRKMWKVPDTTGSLPNPLVNPRVTLISALDSRGSHYMSLSQANSNVETLKLFLSYLA